MNKVKGWKNLYFIFILISFSHKIYPQKPTSSYYYVNSESINLRSGPGLNYSVIQKINKNNNVLVIDTTNEEWWYVDHNGVKGYINSQYLSPDYYFDWEKITYSTGSIPQCENFSPEYDFSLDNYLRIYVGKGIDVVVKLIKITDTMDICNRVVYICEGDSYSIKNIPEGKYYLKIAYGKDFRQKIENNKCIMKFTKNAVYEKGIDTLNYLVQRTKVIKDNKIHEMTKIPSYEIYLYISSNFINENFNSIAITEEDFNK